MNKRSLAITLAGYCLWVFTAWLAFLLIAGPPSEAFILLFLILFTSSIILLETTRKFPQRSRPGGADTSGKTPMAKAAFLVIFPVMIITALAFKGYAFSLGVSKNYKTVSIEDSQVALYISGKRVLLTRRQYEGLLFLQRVFVVSSLAGFTLVIAIWSLEKKGFIFGSPAKS